MAVISTTRSCALILGMLGAVGTAVAARAPVERFGNGTTVAWAGSLTYVPSWLDPDPAMAGGRSVMPVPPRSPAGSLPFTLDFHPNGDGIEVDAPTAIAYSPDGQYILVPAKGKSPNAANLSVYSATDLAPIRVIPLTHAPEAFALMAALPRAVLVNPDDDTVTIVDYEAGTELAIVPVGDLPQAIAISPDNAIAVVQGGLQSSAETSDVPWSTIDLSTLVEAERFSGPPVATGVGTVLDFFGEYQAVDPPIFSLDGAKVGTFQSDWPDIFVNVLDLSTFERTLIPIVSEPLSFGRLLATPDGSLIATSYFDSNSEWHIVTIRTDTWTAQDFNVGPDVSANYPVFLLKPDGSRIVLTTASGLRILDTTTGAVVPADTSGFPYNDAWWPVANVGAGDHFLLWYAGAGDLGYRVFDWNGAAVAELAVPDLTSFGDVFTQLVAASPGSDFRIAFVDPMLVGEDIVLLDLNPSDPQLLVNNQVGDGGIEGDVAVKVSLSADQATALVLNPQSSNAFFLDTQTMARDWIAAPKYVSDATLLPDGDTAVFIAGAPQVGLPIPGAQRLTLVDRATGAVTDVPLPGNTYGRAVALGSDGDYAYTLLGNPDLPDSELARIDLATQQMDTVRLQIPLGLSPVPLTTGFYSDVLVLGVNLNDSARWLAESHDGQLLAVASMAQDGTDSRITLIDRDDWSVVSSISLGFDGFSPWRVEFSPDDSRLYVLSPSAISLIVVDGVNSKLVQQRLSEDVSFWSLTDLVLSPDGSKLYVGVWPYFDFGTAYSVWVLEPETLETIVTIALPIQEDFGFPSSSWLNLNSPMHLRWTEDGSKLYAFSLNGEVHAIDPVTDQVIASIDTGFRAPTSVVPLTDDSRGAGDQFLMASFNSANDGVAILTIEEPVVDVIFESGFEQD